MAKLQLKFAVAAREENRYHTLAEREVARFLQDWLKERHSLPEETATEVADKLAETWRTGIVKELEAEAQEDSSESRDESGPPAAKIPLLRAGGLSTWWSSSPERYSDCTDRGPKGVGWGGREFRNCQEYPGLPDKTEYTHVCRLCWPRGGEGEDSAGETSPALSGDGEALVVGSSYSSWDFPIEHEGCQDIEGDE